MPSPAPPGTLYRRARDMQVTKRIAPDRSISIGTIEVQARKGAASQGVVGGCEKLKVAITLTFLLPSTSMWLLLHVSRFYLWRM